MEHCENVELILASGSPRRAQLLREAGYRFAVVVSGIDEPGPEGFSSPAAFVSHVAWLKAHAVREDNPPRGLPILAADTAAVAAGQILGKPDDRDDARRILSVLSGTDHETMTGVCLSLPDSPVCLLAVETTRVRMKPLEDGELEAYLDTGLWEGKAGAYGIQDHDDPFVTAIDGSWTNVVGLPMERFGELWQMIRTVQEDENRRHPGGRRLGGNAGGER